MPSDMSKMPTLFRRFGVSAILLLSACSGTIGDEFDAVGDEDGGGAQEDRDDAGDRGPSEPTDTGLSDISDLPQDAEAADTGWDGTLEPSDVAEPDTVAHEDAESDTASDVPPTTRPSVNVVNVVRSGAVASLDQYLNGGASGATLAPLIEQFLQAHSDEYDFIYLLGEVSNGTGRYVGANREPIPGAGLPGTLVDQVYGSQRLKGVVGMRLSSSGNGPTLHETAHHWAMFLRGDNDFGFGVDGTTDYGYHWGATSANGQMGGFDRSTLRCVTPATAVPPACQSNGGRMEVVVGEFGPGANGGDVIPYSEYELYLMGLLPASEITEPLVVLDDARFQEYDQPQQTFRFDIAGVHEVSIGDIVAAYGERTPLAESERHYRGAFVVVSDSPASDATMQRAETWARVFGGVEPSSRLLSFEAATGGRATMDVRIWTD